MTTTQLFNPKICIKNNCDKLRFSCCYGTPKDCKINKKAGYPKELKKELDLK